MSADRSAYRLADDAVRFLIAIGVVVAPFAALALLGLGFMIFHVFRPPAPCENAWKSPSTSPDGAYEARLVRQDCSIGIGGDVLLWSVVVTSRSDRSDRSDVFDADDDGEPSRPSFTWTGNDRLRIIAESSLRNESMKTTSDDGRVAISYVYRTGPTPETIAKFHAFCASSDDDRQVWVTWRGDQKHRWYRFSREECGQW